MKIFSSMTDWQSARKQLAADLTLGFVPTMGNLHPGHVSLFERCRRENACVVGSIFINPTQFNQREDYLHYPKTMDEDLALLEKSGVDFCLVPNEEMIYADQYRYQVACAEQPLEGQFRPGHFNGMLTVVLKWLNLVKPQRVYLGEKDYQQYQLINDMVQAFFLDIDVQLCPTIREASGLAYSSRNNRLNPEERKLAEKFATVFHQAKSCKEIQTELAALGIKIDYIEDFENRRFGAVYIGSQRLIDNYALPISNTSA